MAAKLLHSLADDQPDLQKQIGCMNGIFQLFDRHHALTGRRLSHKRLPPGDSHFSHGRSEGAAFNSYHQHTAVDRNSLKGLNEKQRISIESSRASFSSSCSSSFSSLDCNKTAQPEASSFDSIIFPETPSRDTVITQSSTSPRLGRQSLDLRDVIKDSMHREIRALSVKTTTKEEGMSHAVKHKDSPRPGQLSKSINGSYRCGNKQKENVPVDLKESLRVLAKLQEAPWYYNETRECPRSSYEAKDGSWHTISKDAPQFSYDGREINRLSFESRETIKSNPKLKELPRLSLDGREISIRGSNNYSKSNHISKDFQISGNSNEKVYSLQQSLDNKKRPPSVVAKLMGLEALPDSTSRSYRELGSIKMSSVEQGDSFSKSSKMNDMNRPARILKSPRSSLKEPTSPRRKNPNMVMKPFPRLPIEPAPWKQLDGSRGSQKPVFKPTKLDGSQTPNSFPSVYSEIDKRLKDLEFKQSGKDLRALKQILEAMHAKDLLDTRKEEQDSNFGSQRDYKAKCASPNQKSRLLSKQNQQNNHASASASRDSCSSRTYESPIVIMKPAKLVEKSSVPASSVIPLDGLSSPNRMPSGYENSKKGLVNNQTASSRNSHWDSAVNSSDKKTSLRSTKSTQSLTKPQQLPKENTTGSVKSSGSISPRLQQKKLELEKRSRPPAPPSDSNKPRRQHNRQPAESGSLGGKHRLKSPKLPPNDEQLSQTSYDSRTSSHQGDDISLQSDNTVTFDLKSDMEVNSIGRSIEINGSQSPSMKASNYFVCSSMQKKLISRLEEDGRFAELAVAVPEHPSPISVLDASACREDALSPVKQTPNLPRDQQSGGQWIPADNFLSNNAACNLPSEINRRKLQNIENLVQKLRRLNSTHDEASTDYIASLCENTNPDHRYISEVLLASGLLLRDLGSGLTTFQLHPSGHPINPELFFVLEQTKASTLISKEDTNSGKPSHGKPNPEKFHRKLIFDAVNEILVKKLALVGPSPEPWPKSDKLVKKTLSAQKLLKELCSEIEQLQVRKLECSFEDEDDCPKRILRDDVMLRSESWTDFHAEVPGLVLDVERLIFKDLVDEIVIGGAAGLRTKQGTRRQLFAK